MIAADRIFGDSTVRTINPSYKITGRLILSVDVSDTPARPDSALRKLIRSVLLIFVS